MLLPHAGIEVRNTWMLAIETEGAGEIGFFNIPDVYLEDMGKPLALKYMERIARALGAATDGAFDPTVVIDTRGSLDDVPRLYKRLAAQEFLKAVVSPHR